MAISPDTGSSPGQLNFYQQVALSRLCPFNLPQSLCCNLHRLTNASAQSSLQPLLADSLFKPSFLNQGFSRQLAFERLRASFPQSYLPQPTLFSTTSFRNPASHNLSSKLSSSTNASFDHSLSKPCFAQSFLKAAFLNQRCLNKRPSAKAPTPRPGPSAEAPRPQR